MSGACLIVSVGWGCFSVWISGVGRSNSSSGGLQLSGFLGGEASVAAGCGDVGISVFYRLAMHILSMRFHFLGFGGGSDFSFPWGFVFRTFVLWT